MQFKIVSGKHKGHAFAGRLQGNWIIDLDNPGQQYAPETCLSVADDLLTVESGANKPGNAQKEILKLYREGKLQLKKTENHEFKKGEIFYTDTQINLF